MSEPALLICRHDVAAVLSLDDCIVAVEKAFRVLAVGDAPAPAILAMRAEAGCFHLKAGILTDGDRSFFVAKCNANFPENALRCGFPAIQGLIILCDAESGSLLAVMDSIEITTLRTGAATAIAARHLARPDSRVALIGGCGNQGRIQLQALTRVLPIERAFAFDLNAGSAATFASEMGSRLGIPIQAATDLHTALGESDVCVTCTPSRRPFVFADDVRPGTFIAAIGADSHDKQELHPNLFPVATVTVDVLEQCALIGELHHAMEAKVIERDQVHAELGQIVAGLRPGRRSPEEITIFDSTGTAIQDVAAAIAVYRAIQAKGSVQRLSFHD
jgi:ornithine cyclodeaminase/alanine dehydrogenase-like protein (mu-crystallin family)